MAPHKHGLFGDLTRGRLSLELVFIILRLIQLAPREGEEGGQEALL